MNTQLLSAVNELPLFDAPPPKPQRTCKGCGSLYVQVKCSEYCTRKCMNKHTGKLNAKKLNERAKVIQLFEFPSSLIITPQIEEMITLYRDKGVGFAAIAKIQGLSKDAIRRRLIQTGVWRPNPIHQVKKGCGKSPNQRETKRLSRKTKKEALTARRHQVAVCLWALRRGVGVETTCHQNNWIISTVWNLLNKNRAYLRHKNGKTSKGSKDLHRAFRWVSQKYKSEGQFQDAIAEALKGAGIPFIRERQFMDSRDRVDFEIADTWFLECKIDTKPNSFHRGMGQAFQAKLLEKKDVCIIVPDDVRVREDQSRALALGSIGLIREDELLAYCSGIRSGSAIETFRSAGRRITCKCCDKPDVRAAKKAQGGYLSYCIDCESIIHTKEWRWERQRWEDRQELTRQDMPGKESFPLLPRIA
jgi:hypothetical protein